MKKGPNQISLAILLGAACLALSARAQKSAQPQPVTVVVVNALPQPPQPVKAADVSLWLPGEQYQQRPTNSQGVAMLDVASDVVQRSDLRIEITHAGDLVIYLPAGGQLDQTSMLPAKLTIQLLPKGSKLLIEGPGQIEAMLRRQSLEIASLQKQNTALRQYAPAPQRQTPDLGAAIAEWADADGFSSVQVNQQVQQWAEGIEQQSAQATTAEQKALAELALKQYDAAAQLFHQATNADLQQLNAEESQEKSLDAQIKALQAAQQALLDKERASLRRVLDHSVQAASADQLNLKYHEATQTVESAESTAEAEYKKHPDDKSFHELWLLAVSNAANARRKEGEIGPAEQSHSLLAQSELDFQSLAHEYAALGDRQEAASARDDLGEALDDEGQRAKDKEAIALLDRAVQAYQDALEVFTEADLPRDWARTQMGLGDALVDESEHSILPREMPRLEEAVEAFRRALEVYTKADLPQDWARTQMNLGHGLEIESISASFRPPPLSTSLQDQAVEAYLNALQVLTKAAQPQDWAATQMGLGDVLIDEGRRAGVDYDKAMALFDQAAQAYRDAPEVYTRADLPQSWAKAQSKLGYALAMEADLAAGDKAIVLYDHAAQAYRNALEVYTKAALPEDWALTQNGLGGILMVEGERTAPGGKAMALFAQAAEAYRNTLQVWTKADLHPDWAASQTEVCKALTAEGELTSGDRATALFDQAVEACQGVLEFLTNASDPFDWAETQVALGLTLRDEGERASGDKATALLERAVEAFESALEVNTLAHSPEVWAATQVKLGIALDDEGERASGDKATHLLSQAVAAYQSALEVFTRDAFPQYWAETMRSLARSHKDLGDTASADAELKAVNEVDPQ